MLFVSCSDSDDSDDNADTESPTSPSNNRSNGCDLDNDTYSATVEYNNPTTSYSATYTLDVVVSNCQVTQIDFPNGGYLDEDHITPADIDDNGDATVEGEEGKTYLAMDTSAAGTWELHLPSMHFYLDSHNHDICFAGPDRFDNTYSSFIALIHPDDHFMVDQHFRTAINAKTDIDISCRFVNPTGQAHFAHIRGRLVDTSVPASPRFIGIIWDITEKKLLEEKAEELRIDRQREITAAALHAEENERKRISEMLHDSVSQLLYGIKLQLSEKDYAEAIAKANKLLDTVIQETRNISFQLAPSMLADFGLAATVNELCRRLSTPHVQIDANVSGFSAPGELFLEETIFRIIQELVNNCMKHSGASHIHISVKKNKLIEILVTDNGKGFKYEKLDKPPKGAGLISIRNRLALYNGKLDISSAPGKGTTVRVQLAVG